MRAVVEMDFCAYPGIFSQGGGERLDGEEWGGRESLRRHDKRLLRI